MDSCMLPQWQQVVTYIHIYACSTGYIPAYARLLDYTFK